MPTAGLGELQGAPCIGSTQAETGSRLLNPAAFLVHQQGLSTPPPTLLHPPDQHPSRPSSASSLWRQSAFPYAPLIHFPHRNLNIMTSCGTPTAPGLDSSSQNRTLTPTHSSPCQPLLPGLVPSSPCYTFQMGWASVLPSVWLCQACSHLMASA